jgi:hypothetical protein
MTLLICSLAYVDLARAALEPENPVTVRGLIIASHLGLFVNDGSQDYLLLDVDNIGIEGKTCEIFGALTRVDGRLAIDVYRVRLLTPKSPVDDRNGFHQVQRDATIHKGMTHETMRISPMSPCRTCGIIPSSYIRYGMRKMEMANLCPLPSQA